jgi:hypothetical protein
LQFLVGLFQIVALGLFALLVGLLGQAVEELTDLLPGARQG